MPVSAAHKLFPIEIIGMKKKIYENIIFDEPKSIDPHSDSM